VASSARSSASTASPLQSEQPSLGDVLDALIEEAADVETLVDREYSRNGVAFAARPEEDVVELRLGNEIGEAALRTPNTGPSSRGPDWVRFAPPLWDEMAFDRVEAWFRVAWRLAAGRR
jgi:hypothetical protein